ncbi:MAG: hypothetical protein ACJAVA_000663 [Flavobacteriaceae bacterium]
MVYLQEIYKKIVKLTLIAVVLGGLFSLYHFYNPSTHSYFIPCPFNFLTGYHCPGCGSQRAIHQLLHFNILAAFRLNPLMVLSLPLIIYGLGVNAWNFIFDTQHRIKLFYNKLFIYGYFGLAILYWIARNIPMYPFNLLAPTE